jgi:AI-2 transport protein TqsA
MNVKTKNATQYLIMGACIFIILAGLKAATDILVPFLLSAFIAIICSPFINKASEYKVPKLISIVTVISIFIFVSLFLASLVGGSLHELSQLIPQYRTQLQEKFYWLVDTFAQYNINISSGLLIEYFDPAAALSLVANMLSGLGGVMANMFLIVLTVVFMLFEASSLPYKLELALSDPEHRMLQITRFIGSVNHYIAIKTLVSIITGFIVSIMLWAFGLDFYLLWGVLAFLLNYIPNIGSIIAAVPAILLASLQLGLGEAGGIALGYFAINIVMGNVIEPRYLGRGLGLSTLVVFLSLIFWGWLLGTVGMLLSVPLTMVFKIGLESSEGGRGIAILLSGDDNGHREGGSHS